MNTIEERTNELLEILKKNGFDIIRKVWEDCGSGNYYEDYQVIDTKNDNIPLTGTSYVDLNSYEELRPKVKSYNYKDEEIDY